jgi:hypothetical protein
MNRPIPTREPCGRAIGPAADLFDQLEKAIGRRDFALARKLQRELRQAGYSVAYLGPRLPERKARS